MINWKKLIPVIKDVGSEVMRNARTSACLDAIIVSNFFHYYIFYSANGQVTGLREITGQDTICDYYERSIVIEFLQKWHVWRNNPLVSFVDECSLLASNGISYKCLKFIVYCLIKSKTVVHIMTYDCVVLCSIEAFYGSLQVRYNT